MEVATSSGPKYNVLGGASEILMFDMARESAGYNERGGNASGKWASGESQSYHHGCTDDFRHR